jgi:DNA-binding LacI/PurR family transcriptional regulator
MAVTIVQVAKAARVSAATVCRVLNQHPEVAERTRRKVLTALKRIGWPTRSMTGSRRILRPAGTGRGPTLIDVLVHRWQQTETISSTELGVAVGSLQPIPPGFFRDQAFKLESGFYRSLIEGVVEEAGPWGYQTIIQHVRDLRDPAVLARVNRPEKAGVILAGEWSADLELFVGSCPKPLVLLDLPATLTAPVVTMDDHVGISQIMAHLTAYSHRAIAFAGGPGLHPQPLQRYVAWRLHLADAGLPLVKAWVYLESVHMVDVQRWAEALLSTSDRPTAVVCQNDWVALAVLQAARNRGVEVPRQLSVVGYDDGDVARLSVPALTTVSVPTVALGRVALRELLQEVADAADAPRLARRVLVAPTLTIRD